MEINPDAFSHGQIASKLEAVYMVKRNASVLPADLYIWVLGGWHGILPFLLLSQTELQSRISKIRSFDIDPECEEIADKINNAWEIQEWKFKAFTADCNELEYSNDVNLIMNTSVEHFESLDWYNRIPKGKYVLLQATNMTHPQHVLEFNGLKDLKKIAGPDFNLIDQRVIPFEYPDKSFERYVLLGRKG